MTIRCLSPNDFITATMSIIHLDFGDLMQDFRAKMMRQEWHILTTTCPNVHYILQLPINVLLQDY